MTTDGAIFCPMVETKFLPPTNTLGSRVKARTVATGHHATFPWDHALGPAENHELAASKLLEQRAPHWRITHGCTAKDGGYIFAATRLLKARS